MTFNIFELTCDELTDTFGKLYGKGHYHSAALYREIMKNGNRDFETVPEFENSPRLAGEIEKDLILGLPRITSVVSNEGVTKFITGYEDGLEVESVIIPMLHHNTLCVSSQVGCRMGCRFCETGRMGFKRNLTVSEIVAQVYLARFVLKHPIKNLVFMGMGEPFDNFENVVKAIRVLNDQRGFDFAHSHITVSTAGLAGGIEKLGALGWRRINLAVSLNAPNNSLRSLLMPVNRHTPMEDLQQALLAYPLRKNGSFLMEYVLIKGVNDSRSHARELAAYLSPLSVRLNLIPYNKNPDQPFESPTDRDVHRFAGSLEERGVFVRKRWSRGSTLMAGCGQLATRRELASGGPAGGQTFRKFDKQVRQ